MTLHSQSTLVKGAQRSDSKTDLLPEYLVRRSILGRETTVVKWILSVSRSIHSEYEDWVRSSPRGGESVEYSRCPPVQSVGRGRSSSPNSARIARTDFSTLPSPSETSRGKKPVYCKLLKDLNRPRDEIGICIP